MTAKLDLLIPDQHFPLNDPIVWKVYLAVAAGTKFSNIVTTGDMFDMASMSSHARYIGAPTVEAEVHAVKVGLAQLTKAGKQGNKDVRFHWMDGNHEFRLTNYLANQAPHLQKFCRTLDEELDLKTLGWSYYPYRTHLKIGDAYLAHDVNKFAGKTAHQKAVASLHVNIIHAHTHKLAVQFQGTVDGSPKYGAMLGWGGLLSAVSSYKDSLTAQVESVHGFGILKRWVDPQGHSRSTIEAVPVINGSCVVGDKVFSVN